MMAPFTKGPHDFSLLLQGSEGIGQAAAQWSQLCRQGTLCVCVCVWEREREREREREGERVSAMSAGVGAEAGCKCQEVA